MCDSVAFASLVIGVGLPFAPTHFAGTGCHVRQRQSSLTASIASLTPIFFPSRIPRLVYRIGTSMMPSPMRHALAVTSGQNSNRRHVRSIARSTVVGNAL